MSGDVIETAYGRVLWRPDCRTCAENSPSAVAPPHDASDFCESGRLAHCSCGRCFS